MRACLCRCACVCVMTFPWRARARFINHKHEPVDPITLRRCRCLLSSVKCKERREGGSDTCLQAYLSLWTLALKYPHNSLVFIVRVFNSSALLPVYVTMNKRFGMQILLKHCCLHNKWIDWQESAWRLSLRQHPTQSFSKEIIGIPGT